MSLICTKKLNMEEVYNAGNAFHTTLHECWLPLSLYTDYHYHDMTYLKKKECGFSEFIIVII